MNFRVSQWLKKPRALAALVIGIVGVAISLYRLPPHKNQKFTHQLPFFLFGFAAVEGYTVLTYNHKKNHRVRAMIKDGVKARLRKKC